MAYHIGGVMKKTIVIVNDKMQRGYCYQLSAEMGEDFDPQFRPDFTPPELLRLGIFCGKYMTDCRSEFPPDWFEGAKLASGRRDCSLNYFGVDASQPSRYGARKAGSTPTTHAVGSNGIADTTSAGDCPKRMPAKSSAGKPCGVT
jgi:hypothetical protein